MYDVKHSLSHSCVCIDSFYVQWLHYRRARVSWALEVFGVTMCEIQASISSVLNDRRSCFTQGETSVESCMLLVVLCPLDVWYRFYIWKQCIHVEGREIYSMIVFAFVIPCD